MADLTGLYKNLKRNFCIRSRICTTERISLSACAGWLDDEWVLLAAMVTVTIRSRVGESFCP